MDQLSFENAPQNIGLLPDYTALNFESISVKYRSKSLVLLGIWFAVMTIGMITWMLLEDRFLLQLYVSIAISIIFLLRVVIVWEKQKTFGYALRDKDIVYKRGLWIEKITVIPFNRIQHVSTARDAFDKVFNIASLQVFTAGGSGSDISIPGLDPELATQIKERIIQKVDDAR